MDACYEESVNVPLGIGRGELSGDSEDSLNPSQPRSSNDRSLARARDKSKEVQARTERLREQEQVPQQTGVIKAGKLDIGPASMFVNLRGSDFDRDREATDTERGFDGDSLGIEVGVDYRLSDRVVVGGMVSY